MKVEVVLNVKKAYCNADEFAELVDILNKCNVEKLDDERVKLSFNDEQLKLVLTEYYTLERFIRDSINRSTEALENVYAYQVLDIDDIVEDINVEFSDDDIERIENLDSADEILVRLS